MSELASHPAVLALAWTLAHFLWQGAAVAIVAFAAMRTTRRASARYAIGVAALAMMIAAPAATFTVLQMPSAPPTPSSQVTETVAAVAGDAPSAAVPSHADPARWWAAAGVLTWIMGVVLLTVRLAGGLLVAERLARRSVRPAALHVQILAADLSVRLGLRRVVEVLESSAVAVPVLVGWLRPTIVFPAAALAGLSPAQVEALLAHELAHVRRHDYLANLLQAAAEVALFYHPAVWWLSRRVRAERELCCDDVAVAHCDRLVYATALSDLAAMTVPHVALAATGGDLVTRVRRVLGREEWQMSMKARWMYAGVIAAVAVLVVPAVVASSRGPQANQPAAPVNVPEEALVAVPEALIADAIELRGNVSARSQSDQPAELDLGGARLVQQREQARVVEAEQARRTVEQAANKARIEDAKRNLERMRVLYDNGLATSAQVIEAERALARLEAGGDQRRLRELEIEAVRRTLTDARTRAEIGTMAPSEVAELEKHLRALESGEAAQEMLVRELADARRQHERTMVLLERGLITRERAVEAEVMVAELEQKLLKAQVERVRADERARVKEETRAVSERERMLRERELEAQAERHSIVARDVEDRPGVYEEVSRPIAATDVVRVTIEGETRLPTTYTLLPDGTIRIPLLGAFKALGVTPAELRTAIGRKLSTAGLGSAAKVRVALRRIERVQVR